MLTPGRIAPLGSVTRPTMLPDEVWPKDAGAAQRTIRTARVERILELLKRVLTGSSLRGIVHPTSGAFAILGKVRQSKINHEDTKQDQSFSSPDCPRRLLGDGSSCRLGGGYFCWKCAE